MGAVITIVSGRVEASRRGEVIEPYRAATANGPPAYLESTFLVEDEEGMAIISVWRDRELLETYISSVDEPLARRLIREAGATPEVRIMDVVARA